MRRLYIVCRYGFTKRQPGLGRKLTAEERKFAEAEEQRCLRNIQSLPPTLQKVVHTLRDFGNHMAWLQVRLVTAVSP